MGILHSERGYKMRMKCWIWILLLMQMGGIAHSEEYRYMRVVSRDHTQQAQTEKIKVRDAVLSMLPEDFKDWEGYLPEIEKKVKEMSDGHVEIKKWAPPGMESASCLYITLGRGDGPNWWGILYPKGMELFSDNPEGEKTVFVWPLLERLARWLGIGKV